MKHYIIALCYTLALATSATAEIELEVEPRVEFELEPELKQELPIGIEAVTGYRSDYIYKGSKLAGEVVDFQLSGELAYSDYQFLRYSLWYVNETGDGDFSETGFSLKYLEQIEQFDYYVGLKYRNISDDILDSTAELFAGIRWHKNEFFSVGAEVTYDTEVDGWHSELSLRHLRDINKDSFVSIDLGLSAVHNYYGEDGVYDVFSRLSYTYNITKTVSFSPFVGTSFQHYGADRELLYGGAWFEVSF